jgi:anti-anti-sigma regulatory factor
VFICDLNSGGSTFVNANEIPHSEEWPLHAGDLIDVGPLRFMVQYHERNMSKKDLEEWALKCLDLDAGRRISAMDTLEAMAAMHVVDDAASAASAILDQLSAKSGIVKGRLRISRESNVTIVRINDRSLVDGAELSLVKKELFENLNRPNLKILLDLKHVHQLSSSGAEMIGELQRWLRPFGSRLALCRLRGEMQKLLKTLPSTSNIPVYDEKPHAISGNW